jgi:hypothetical protein
VKGVCDSRGSRDCGESQVTWELSKSKGLAKNFGFQVTPRGLLVSTSLTIIFANHFHHLDVKDAVI